VYWSEQENVLWRAPVPGRGHASPVLWGDRIFLATADETRQAQSLVCLRRADGQLLWQTDILQGGFMHSDRKNSHATATPACDGERVFTAFMAREGVWASATGFDGRLLWQKKLGPFKSEYGFASSPLIHGDLVIFAADNPLDSHLTALRRATGEVVWQTARARGISFGSPVAANLAGKPQVLLSGQGFVAGYAPADGREIWRAQGLSSVTVSSIAWWRDHVLATSDAGSLLIRADGAGDVTASHVRWVKPRARAYVTSPLVVGDWLLLAQDGGFLICLEAGTGRELWKERLGGNLSASPVAAGGLVFLPNEAGRTFVCKPGAAFELLAENDLRDSFLASPAVGGGRLYLRGEGTLYCIGENPSKAPPAK